MRFHGIVAGVIGLWVWSLGTSLQAEIIIEETFTGYLDNALISASPAGPAIGLTDDWRLVPNSDFYVNKTQADNDAGTGQAVYDRPPGDNGTRTATRSTSTDHVLFATDGDLFYASFLIDPALDNGGMTFELELTRLDGGGTPNFAFGIIDGEYTVGNGGIDVDASGGTVTADEQLVLVRIEYGDAESGPDDSEVVTLWVDPVDELSTPVINGVATDFLNRGGGKITAVSIRGEQMSGNPAFFDNLRVGASFAAVIPEPLLGDVNLDGEVNGLDVDPFVDILLNGPYQPEADMNEDEVVNGLDVEPFVTAIVDGGTQPVPEPSTFLLGLIALGVVGGGWRAKSPAIF
jgi:hypothetical protein